MASLRIHPLHLGTITREKSSFGYRLEPGQKVEAPLIAWYIEGASKRILVDTGGADPSEVPRRSPYRRDKNQSIDNALRKLGLRCSEIDIVIITHLHWDHCGGTDKFPDAQIIVQEEELISARSPLPLYYFEDYKRFVDNINYTVISGDKQLVEGVTVFFTPGHTYGMQGVLVDAETRKYFIASDTIGLFECLNREPPLISGVYVDLRKYYDSLAKITKLSAFILPGHDFKVFGKEIYL